MSDAGRRGRGRGALVVVVVAVVVAVAVLVFVARVVAAAERDAASLNLTPQTTGRGLRFVHCTSVGFFFTIRTVESSNALNESLSPHTHSVSPTLKTPNADAAGLDPGVLVRLAVLLQRALPESERCSNSNSGTSRFPKASRARTARTAPLFSGDQETSRAV